MMSIKPFLLATLPGYFLMAGVCVTAIGSYELELAFFGPFPGGSPGPEGIAFFGLFMVGFLAECLIFSRLTKKSNLQDIRVKLPRHWRSVILDMISWSNSHPSAEPVFVVGLIGGLGALAEGVTYGLMAVHAPAFIFWAVGLLSLFVVLFVAGTIQVLIRSTISPVGEVSAEEFAEIYETLPKLTGMQVEFLKKDRTFTPSPMARKSALLLFAVALVALPIAMVESYMHLMYLAQPISYVGGAAAMIGIVLIGFPISGKKVSELSRRLQGPTGDTDAS